jgi:hypothetical protein
MNITQHTSRHTSRQGRHTPLLFFSWLVIVFAANNHVGFAQLSEADSTSWRGKLSSGGTLITGNVERLLWITTAEISFVEPEEKMWGFKSANTYQYGTFAKRLTENDIISRNFVYLFPKTWLYPYVMLWLEKNYRRRFDMRYQLGPGATLVVLNERYHTLKISATLTNEQTTFNGSTFRDMPDLAGNVQNLWRITGRVAGRSVFFDSKLRLLYEAWYQQGLSGAQDYRYLVEAALEFPFARNAAVRSALSYTRDNVVLVGVERADVLLTFGLSLLLE